MSAVLGGALVALAVAVAAALLARPVARRLGTTTALAAGALAAVGLVLGLTLGIRLFETTGTRVGVGLPSVPCVAAGDCVDRVVELDALWWLNVALFVPAGLLVALAVRRPALALAGLAALSLAVELLQGVTGLGSPDPGDLVANTLGAAVGVGAGALVLRGRSSRSEVAPVPRSRSRSALWALGAGAAVALLWLVVVAGADARRAALADDVRAAFAGTTAADVAAGLATPDGAERLFSATDTRPGYLGEVGSSGVYEARYSTQFFGVDRCVFARWDDQGLTLIDGAGGVCTEFRDGPPAEPGER